MSGRALEFVETWVSEKIEAMDALPTDGDKTAKALATQCFQAALDEGIPAFEIQDAIDDLAAFIGGEIEEARDRKEGPSDEEDDEATHSDEDE
jgi:hypothetical protein